MNLNWEPLNIGFPETTRISLQRFAYQSDDDHIAKIWGESPEAARVRATRSDQLPPAITYDHGKAGPFEGFSILKDSSHFKRLDYAFPLTNQYVYAHI